MKLSLSTSAISIATAWMFVLLSNISFSQTSHLHLLLNAANTNFNYGKSNSALQPFKKHISGAQVGVTFQGGITQNFSLVAEPYFIMKGGTLKNNNPLTTNKSTVRLYQMEMPVLARLHFGKFYINSGPYAAYLLGGRIKTEGSETIPASSRSVSFDDEAGGFKRWDMGVQAGAGYVFKLKKSSLALDLRYGYGLTNISRDEERYNRVLNFSIRIFKPWKSNPLAKRV
jgi:hypothetical protein